MTSFFVNVRMLLGIYATCLRKSAERAVRHGLILLTIFAYVALYYGVGFITAPLGIVGGFILGLVLDACLSSALVMVESMVKDQLLSIDDFKRSFGTYFFDVMGVLFVLWIVSLAMTPLRAAGHIWLVMAVRLSMFILFNPLPELIYAGGYGTTELFAKAYEFIRDNWIEWFVPNILLGIAIWAFLQIDMVASPVGATILNSIFYAFFFYFFMIFRGLLFQELHRSSRRMRMFQYRTQR